MKALRNIAAAPFLILGVVFAWLGVAFARVGYFISDGADPLGLDDPHNVR